jgi:hypothetical protein
MKMRAFLLLLICLACDREDEVLVADEGTLKTLLDNKVRSSSAVSAKINSSSGSEIIDIAAEFPEGTVVTELLISAYVNNSNDMISARDYEFASKLDPGPYDGVCFYFLNDGNAPFATLYVGQPDVGKLTITELDRTAMVVSGTFNATVSRNDEAKVFTNGSFTKIPLTIN